MPHKLDPDISSESFGRYEKPIDWKYVETAMRSAASGAKIAAHFRMHPNTFYRRFQLEYGCHFSDVQPMGDEDGQGMILVRQFTSAMAGNTTMLKILGEERCGQGRKANDLPPNDGELQDIHAALKKDLQSNDDPLKELHASLNESPNAQEEEIPFVVPPNDLISKI